MRTEPPRIAACLLAAALAGCGAPQEDASAGEFRNLAPDVAYVGEEACRSCHLEVASTHSHTGMGRSFYPMSADVAVEDFTDRNEIEIPGSPLRYRMTERDGKYYQRQFVVDGLGREAAVDEREMVFVAGSGNHSRSYVTVLDDKLFQMPICWYPDAAVWDLCPGYEFGNDYFKREIDPTCVFCHNGRMVRVDGTRNRYEEPFPEGIDCERCHGPGQLHVARWERHDETPTGNLDPTIVNPRRLPLQERLHVCYQCHLGDARSSERVPRYGKSMDNYRPGLLITDMAVPFQYAEIHEGEFGISSQADRFLLSRCYRESAGKLECLSCHNPHVTVYQPDRRDDFFRSVCLGCHATEDCAEDHGARQQTAPQDDCVRCHMKKTQPDDHRHTEVTDHWIRRTIDDGPPHPRASVEIEPVFPEAFDELPAAERQFYQARVTMLKSLEMIGPIRDAMWAKSESGFRAAIRGGFDNAEAWFFLGKILTYQRRWADAENAFREGNRKDPAHHGAAFGLGQELVRRGDLAGAIAVFEEMLRLDPEDPSALAEIGRCRVAMRDAEGALPSYTAAVSHEPWNAHLHANRGAILAALGRLDEAIASLGEAVRTDPEDPQMWAALVRALSESGREADANAVRHLAGSDPLQRGLEPRPPGH